MTVASVIKPGSDRSNLASMISRGAKMSLLLASLFVAGQASAAVPVVESQPTVQGVTGQEVFPQPTLVAKADAEGSTAYLLNVIDQLRTEMMELRGRVEEQGFLIKQLQQENRDRYLDLDERISRIGGAGAVSSPVLQSGTHTASVKSPVLPVSVTDNKQEEDAYQAAFQLIRDKRFDDALAALKKLLTDHPSGSYADNAQYWLGEVQMAQGQYPAAKDAFLAVLKNYPESPKVPDATYKLGRLSDMLGDKKQARDYLESVISKYPDTAASRLSDTYLQSLSDS